ncbi:MAG: thioredoxin [Olsenella sp.]|nr:thioredoxin [Olsenella sp.]
MAVSTITAENFESEVINSDKPVLIDFWASWCGPCRAFSPIVDEFAENTDAVKVGKVNVDEQPELAKTFNVMSIPTVVVMKGEKVLATNTGSMPKAMLEDFVSKATLGE